MSMLILRRRAAYRDVEEIANYIAEHNLTAAIQFMDNAEVTIGELGQFPSSGSPYLSNVPGLEGIRFHRIKGFPNHLVFYRAHQDAIEVIRVLHGARNLDAELRKA